MLGIGALGQLALAQFPIAIPSQSELYFAGDGALRVTGELIARGVATLPGNGTFLVNVIHHAFSGQFFEGSSSMIVSSYVFQPYNVPIINGWYVDSKGGINYYYRTPDGRNLPRPPVRI